MQELPKRPVHDVADLARMQQFRETSGGLNISANALDGGNLREGRLVGRNLASKPATSQNPKRLRTE
jgi:hypothetical protein